MRIFGDLLPFVGFRSHDAHESAELGLDRPAWGLVWHTFEIEWFGFGLILFGKQTPR